MTNSITPKDGSPTVPSPGKPVRTEREKESEAAGPFSETKAVSRKPRGRKAGAIRKPKFFIFNITSDGQIIAEKELSSENQARWESAMTKKPYGVVELFIGEVNLTAKEPVIERKPLHEFDPKKTDS